ncbi:hypothetical protein [Rhodocyclus tenuis]|nr:hypothetical protein [Rhodocyclus tenuis]
MVWIFNKKIPGLILLFLPEFILLAIWVLFKSSILDIRAAMFSQTIEMSSVRLIAVSGALLVIAQAFRIFAFQTGEEVFWEVKKVSIGGLVVIFFIILGVASELPRVENVMNESYASMVIFFITMTGAIYLFVEIFVSLISLAMSFMKRG